MTDQRDLERVHHMLEAARQATSLTHGLTRNALDENSLLALALERLLEILGEAANRVSESFRASHPEVPWREIIGTRNRLIHAYFKVDLDITWEIIKSDLPRLISELEYVETDS